MEHLITDYVLQYGYLAVFVLMVLESACIPVPSEVTMLFGGALANGAFLASLGQQGEHLNFVVVALVGAFGNLVGSWIAWGVGYRGGRPLIERWDATCSCASTSWTGPRCGSSAAVRSPCWCRGCCRWCGPSSACRPAWPRCASHDSRSIPSSAACRGPSR